MQQPMLYQQNIDSNYSNHSLKLTIQELIVLLNEN